MNLQSDFHNVTYGQTGGNGHFPGNWSHGIPIGTSGLGSTAGSDGLTDSDNEETSRLPSQSGQSCHSSAKKRRRGIIEKKRRDRINTSLAELKRLVPAAFEKQGSQKLEKAEILQMTVEHLKLIQSKGVDALMYDPQRFSADYHSMGYRECASEVNRCLSEEGIGVQDPLRMRLMSHLQCYSAQRAAAISSWNSVYPSQQWGYTPPAPPNPTQPPTPQSYVGANQTASQSAFTPTPMFKPTGNTFSQTAAVTTATSTGNGPANFAASFLTSQAGFPAFTNVDPKTHNTLNKTTWNPIQNGLNVMSR